MTPTRCAVSMRLIGNWQLSLETNSVERNQQMAISDWFVVISVLVIVVYLWLFEMRSRLKYKRFVSTLAGVSCPKCNNVLGHQSKQRVWAGFLCPKDYFYHDSSSWPLPKDKIDYQEIFGVGCVNCGFAFLITTSGVILEIIDLGSNNKERV